jgi:hypothetical protein
VSQSLSGRCGQNKISRSCRDSIPCRAAPNLVAIPTTLFPDPEKIKRLEKWRDMLKGLHNFQFVWAHSSQFVWAHSQQRKQDYIGFHFHTDHLNAQTRK